VNASLVQLLSDVTTALLAVKTLGRNPSGSEQLSEAATLSKLLSLTKILIERNDINAASEALRCIANTMVLFPDARLTFISDEVNGGEVAISMLHVRHVTTLILASAKIGVLLGNDNARPDICSI